MNETLIQICSDLHLEARPFDEKTLIPSADIICIAGDIESVTTEKTLKTFDEFFAKISTQFKHIFFVCGNHEFYNDPKEDPKKYVTIDETYEIVTETLKKYQNVHFLRNQVYVLNGIRFVGATLWSYIFEEKRDLISQCFSNFKLIYYFDEEKKKKLPMTPSHSSSIHAKELEWIKSQAIEAKKENQKCVVLTHYGPSFSLVPSDSEQSVNSPIGSSFVSDLDYIFSDPSFDAICLWVYGHTHFSRNMIIGNARVVSNQYGYPQEYEITNFKNKVIVKI
ncbi:ser/thr protein phosphatase superfamily [Anaeramoeba ignava]|uniref:Ser/thr protein phosphatase superfamily n=1 Tax=Anaeramoeba ignava TaxID=1746090 RepID=A0A9Q0LU46_ANAIG|nr:ser/thr protein phosphatase superfamily [Anaeramoeba ignava]